MPIITECCTYLASNATGKWHETFRLKEPKTDNYMHVIQRNMLVLRVEGKDKRAFYWIYNVQDALQFNQYVGLALKMEAHEMIITPRCRMFFDIDLKLTEYQKCELADSMDMELTDSNEVYVMEAIGKRLAVVFKDATMISLEEHGLDMNLDSNAAGLDWLSTMRNRVLLDDGYKISIHIVMNLVVPLKACAAIVNHIKNDVIQQNIEILGISDDAADLIVGAIDTTQYHRNGSLSLPFGTKPCDQGFATNWIYKDYATAGQYYFLTVTDIYSIDDLDLSEYNIGDSVSYAGEAASPEFVKEALKHVNNIADYSPRVWDIATSVLRKSTMYVKRYAPSMCTICERTHDSDNTLFLIFNSERGVASWKFARHPEMKPIVFFRSAQETDTDDNEIEAFAKRLGKSNTRAAPHEAKVTPTRTAKATPIVGAPPQLGAQATDDTEAFAMRYVTLSICTSEDTGEDPFDAVPRNLEERGGFNHWFRALHDDTYKEKNEAGCESSDSDSKPILFIEKPKVKRTTISRRRR